MSKPTGVNLKRIFKSLKVVQKHFDGINDTLTVKRDPLDDFVLDNMISAFSYLNEIIALGVDLFSDKGLSAMLELNHLALCGSDENLRREYRFHIQSTREKFFDMVAPLRRWYRKHQGDNPVKVAAEMYVGVLSQPQVFIEGNHRTGSLISSWVLVTHNHGPFVLTRKNAIAYFEPSSQIKFTDKRTIHGRMKLPKYKKEFRTFLEKNSSKKFLIK
jgi:hypothetical protein